MRLNSIYSHVRSYIPWNNPPLELWPDNLLLIIRRNARLCDNPSGRATRLTARTQHASGPMDRLAKSRHHTWPLTPDRRLVSQLKDHGRVEDYLLTAGRRDTHTFAVLPYLMELTYAHARHPYTQDFLHHMKRAMMHAPHAMLHSRCDAGVTSYTRQQSAPKRCWSSWFPLGPTAQWFQRPLMPNNRQGWLWVRRTNNLPDIHIRLDSLKSSRVRFWLSKIHLDFGDVPEL